MDDSRSLPLAALPPNPGPSTVPHDLDLLLIGLISAANTLALSHFRAEASPTTELNYSICTGCGRTQRPHDCHLHSSACRVGAVVNAIGTLEEYFEARRNGQPSAADLDRAAEEETIATVTASPNDQADGFGEPWVHVFREEYETVETADGRIVVDMTGSDMILEDEGRFARRIRACVNFCAELPTEQLENERLIDFKQPFEEGGVIRGGKLFVVGEQVNGFPPSDIYPTLVQQINDTVDKIGAHVAAQEGGAL